MGRRGFVELLGCGDAFAAPEWDFALYRMANVDAIRLIASDVLRSRSRDEVVAKARQLGVPLAPINTPDEFVAAYTVMRRHELQRFDDHVTDWELDEYVEVF